MNGRQPGQHGGTANHGGARPRPSRARPRAAPERAASTQGWRGTPDRRGSSRIHRRLRGSHKHTHGRGRNGRIYADKQMRCRALSRLSTTASPSSVGVGRSRRRPWWRRCCHRIASGARVSRVRDERERLRWAEVVRFHRTVLGRLSGVPKWATLVGQPNWSRGIFVFLFL
jgi:hypothetical protein